MNTGDSTPGRGNAIVALDYERRIRSFLLSDTLPTRTMALKLLSDARHDRCLSAEELRRLEGLFAEGQ